MKLRLMIAILVLGIAACSARAQSPNCTQTSASLSGDAKTYNPGNQYVASEIVTYTVSCTNTDTLITTSSSNAVTATGGGGWTNGFPNTFVACNPIFGYSLTNPSTTASNGYFQNVGQDNTWDSISKACFAAAYHINTTYCQSVACATCVKPPKPSGNCWTWSADQCQWVYNATGTCGSSPLLIDVAGRGFFLTSAEAGVRFDISGIGNPVQMGWTAQGANNAFLALPGPDGLIGSGKELFGNFTPQPPCPTGDTCSPNGFRALAVYDDPKNGGNGDGIIDARDAIFSSLRLWIDANHDGISQPNELYTLPALGINSISLNYKASEKTDQYGNVFRYRAQVNPSNPTDAGKTAYDVFFVVQPPTTTARSCPAPPTGKRSSSILKH